MSGYRTLHREGRQLDAASTAADADAKAPPLPLPPLWSARFSPCHQHPAPRSPAAAASPTSTPVLRRLLTSSADGTIRAYLLSDKTAATTTASLDATAVKLRHTHMLLGQKQDHPIQHQGDNVVALGCAAFDVVRNYAGSDPNAGDEVVVGTELDGTVRVWIRKEQEQEQQQQQPHVDGDADPEEAPEVPVVRSAVEFKVDGATGTTCAIRPPMLGSILGNTAHSSRSKKEGSAVVVVALGCLDGSVALVSTGVRLHDVSSNESNGVTDDKDDSAGTTTTTAQGGRIYCRLGTGSAVVTSLAWCPSSSLRDTLAVGRKDGAVDLYSLDENGSGGGGGGASGGGPSYRRIHRILCHPKPVRGLTFTADSALLIVGDDEGTLTVHDVVRTSRPTSPIGMVGSVLNAHTSYILDIAPLSDGKRFVSSGADGVVQVWDVGMLNSGPVHTFADGRGTGMVWAVAASSDGRRLATAHDNGVLVIYSAEE